VPRPSSSRPRLRERSRERPRERAPRAATPAARDADRPRGPRAPSAVAIELTVASGLVDVAVNEVRELARRSKRPLPGVRAGDDTVAVDWHGDPRELHALRTVQAVARRYHFDVPRPKALLGDAALRELTTGLAALRAAAAPARFAALRLSAAGSDSAVMRRLGQAFADALGLPLAADGDLLVRVRPGAEGGWEVLARTTPRPLSVRSWRVCDRPGGLDAALAAALVRLAGVRPGERVCNPMLGSGTLLLERALAGPAGCLHGFDLDAVALDCSERNAAAAGVLERLHLWQADVTAMPSPVGGRYDLLLVDPPWGDAVGDHGANEALYHAMLRGLAGLAARAARLVLVTHEVRLTERLLGQQSDWALRGQRRVWQGGHRPLCLLLERLPRTEHQRTRR
jgi:tRNA (guanine6-N2)-methyltransferase